MVNGLPSRSRGRRALPAVRRRGKPVAGLRRGRAVQSRQGKTATTSRGFVPDGRPYGFWDQGLDAFPFLVPLNRRVANAVTLVTEAGLALPRVALPGGGVTKHENPQPI